MTEQQCRQAAVDLFVSWLGWSEANGKFKAIIDLYNTQVSLPRGYAVQYTDEWCATSVSAVGVSLGWTDIIPPECSCGKQIELFQALGCWMETDGYSPSIGDIIYYYWSDSGTGDCTGWPNHVGMVVSVDGNTITIIEGNKGEAVAYRTMTVDGKYIRGYGLPNYASKAAIIEEDDDMDLARFQELMAEHRVTLRDNDSSSYSEEAREWAVTQGIIAGSSTTEFNGMWEDFLTREQLATVLYRFAQLMGKA